MLKLEIVSSRVVDAFEKDKKFVAYMVQVRQDATETKVIFDPDPANVERRYTHFLDLYNGLKKEQPTLFQNITFPRKVSTYLLPNVHESLDHVMYLLCIAIETETVSL